MTADQLTLGIQQFAPRLRAPAENLARIVDAAAGVDLLLTPELSLTGYDVGDAAHHLALPLQIGAPFPLAEAHTDSAIVLGVIERGHDGTPYNTCTLVRQGRVLHRHRKIYLPTYGMFDEARFFGSSDVLDPFELDGWRIGMLVCEDFWHPGLVYVLAAAGIDLLVVQAAGPGRGVWEAADDAMPFASMESWTRIARTTALLYGIYVALANRTGVEGAVTFGGGSIIVAPDGSVLAEAGSSDARLEAVLRRADLLAARRPGSHVRDEDPHIVRRALDRWLGGSMDQRSARIAGVIAGVLRQAIADSGADRIVLLADGSPEAGLLASMLEPRLGASFRTREVSGAGWPELLDGWAGVAREQPRALVGAASNKTAALLGGALPGPLLPLGDLWASQVQALCGAWSGPRELQELAGRAGGIDALDAALAMLVDRRRLPEEATAALPDDPAGTLLALWERSRFARRRLGLVPKLGARTIGVDLFD